MAALHHLAIIWLSVLFAVALAHKTKLTPVLYYLAVGAILVNLGLLPVEPDPFLESFGELGIIAIMFALGFEEDTSNFMSSIRKSWGIAFFGALTPFLVAYSIAIYYWQDHNLALMVGLTMTATAVSLTMVTLKGEGLSTSPAATRVMTSAVLDDIASLALVAILVPVATGEVALEPVGIALILGKAVGFFILVSALGIWVFPYNRSGWLAKIPILNRSGVHSVLAFREGEYATLSALLLALIVGLLAHHFGFHPAIGAYMAGLILHREYFDHPGERDSYQDTRRIVDVIAYTWAGPVFFVLLGTKIVLDWSIVVSVIPQTLLLLFGVFFGQIASASLAARYTGDLDWAGSLMVGFGMLGRAELAFVVINIAYVQYEIINTEAFYMLMFAIFWLNIAVGVSIRFWRPYYVRSMQKTGGAPPGD